jgi:hypothetical protein
MKQTRLAKVNKPLFLNQKAMVDFANVFEAVAELYYQEQAETANIALKAVGDIQEACST